MVDVGGNDGAPPRDFIAHEFGRDALRHARAQRVAGQAALAAFVVQIGGHPFAAAVFAQGDVFHLGRDDAFARVVHLGDVAAAHAAPGAARLALQPGGFAPQLLDAGQIALFVLAAVIQDVGDAARVALGVAALGNPAFAHGGQALAHVNRRIRVGVRAGGVVERHHFVVGERDIANGHAQIRPRALDVALARGGKRLAREGEQLLEFVGGIHRRVSCERWRKLRRPSGAPDG